MAFTFQFYRERQATMFERIWHRLTWPYREIRVWYLKRQMRRAAQEVIDAALQTMRDAIEMLEQLNAYARQVPKRVVTFADWREFERHQLVARSALRREIARGQTNRMGCWQLVR